MKTKTITLTTEQCANINNRLRDGIRWCRFQCTLAYDENAKPIADKMDKATKDLSDAIDAWNTFAEAVANTSDDNN